MPTIIAAVAAVVTAVIEFSIATIGFTATLAIASAIDALVLSAGASLLAKKPKTPSLALGGFSQTARDRTVTARQPIAPSRVIYGRARVGGIVTFLHSTNDNQFLHLVITLFGHEIDAIENVYFDGALVPLDGAGEATGTFAGFARVLTRLGTAAQTAYQELIDDTGGLWTSDHRQRGRANAYVRLKFSRDLYPTGVPNITFDVRGKKIFDPRTSTTVWSPNPALALSDYLTESAFGLAAVYADEIDATKLTAAANVCEERVAVVEASKTFVADASTDDVTLQSEPGSLKTGDGVEVSSGGTLPAPLAAVTRYYWIERTDTTGRLATTFANAIAGTQINITDAGSGTHTLTRKDEARYLCHGVFETSERPKDLITALLTAMDGRSVNVSGVWSISAAVWAAPTVTLTEDDLRGPIAVQTTMSRREAFNAVKGVYVDPANDWQPADFPPVTNATYLAADNNERVWHDIELPFTVSPSTAQRLAKIALERARQEITVKLPCKLSAYQVQPPEVVQVTNSRLGWTAKAFEVIESRLVVEEDAQGNPFLGVDLFLREIASAIFDWNSGEETVIDPAPNTDIPTGGAPAAPGAPALSEQLYQTTGSSGVKARAVLTWSASPDAQVISYQLEYKLSADSAWIVLPVVADTTTRIDDIAPGTYDFRVKAINTVGATSAYASTFNKEIFGLTARPTAVANLGMASIENLAFLTWDQSSDLDVRIGGRILFRHSAKTTGASWVDGVSIGEASGDATSINLPLLQGTYLAKAEDSSGNRSTEATAVITTKPAVLNLNFVQIVTEDPAFGGTHTNTIGAESKLKLVGQDLWDSRLDNIDTWERIDALGGITGSGTYLFAGSVDLGAVFTSRLTAAITALAVVPLDTIDQRTTNMDTWDSFDALGGTGDVDAALFVRFTDDDPSGAPTWGAWQPFAVGDYTARAFQFKLELSSTDASTNIEITALSVTVDMPDRSESAENVSVAAGGLVVTFANAFKETPALGFTIENAVSGDHEKVTSKSASGFTIQILDNGESGVARTIDWIAKGFGAQVP
ncbi:MAG: phage tail protein [bacterium]|nr:phage tail protein [bacterium]